MDEEQIRVLIVEDNPGDARLLREFLGEVSSVQFELTHAELLSDALRHLAERSFDAVLLDLRLPDSQGIETFVRLHQQAPGVPVVVLTGLYDESLAVKAVEDGAQDYLVKGHVDGESLSRSIRYAIARQTQAHAAEQPHVRGKVIGFMGAKGGAGTTTVALNVAAAAARQGKSVIAAEIRSCYGTFAAHVGRAGIENISHLLRLDPQAIDEREIGARLLNLEFGPRILLSPQSPNEFTEIAAETAEALIEALAFMAEIVVIDLPSYPCAASEATVRHSDLTVMVVEREPGSIASAKVTFELLKSWGISTERIGAVFVNRSSSTIGASLKDLRLEIGCNIVGAVPQAAESCLDAQRRGQPLVLMEPDSMAATSLVDLTNRLTADGLVPMSF